MKFVPLNPAETVRRVRQLKSHLEHAVNTTFLSDRVAQRSIRAMQKEIAFHERIQKEREATGYSATAADVLAQDLFVTLCRTRAK